MTKDEFVSGKEFRISKGFFKYKGEGEDVEIGHISKVYRSNDETRVIMEDYHMNVTKIGRVRFEAFTYCLGKKVERKLKFSELEMFINKESV
jgi:hypothetical protein